MTVLDRVDALRACGWLVAVHNDYLLGGRFHTFWLFVRGNQAAKGEGLNDEIAVRIVEAEIERLEGEAAK